ncbi:MAG: DUF4476 domain-containing protein [Bacteroidetes bacterium]|nr:DUF4476 domain-containing protein [Bacteroidota bacterium]
MKSIFLFVCLSACFFLSSQSNLSIFNNSGQRFYVIMNGIKQNSIAQTNVSVSGIKDGGYSVKLIFEDGKTPDIDKNFFLDAASDITTKVVFKKGKGKLQLVSMLPTSGVVQTNSVTYRPNDTFIYSDQQPVQTNQSNTTPNNGNVNIQTVNTTSNTSSQNSNSNQNSIQNAPIGNQQMNVSSSSAVTNTSSNVTSGNTPQNVQLSVGVNTNGFNDAPTDMLNGNVNLSINLNGNLNGSINESQTTQTTITQTQTGTSSTDVNSSQYQPNQNNSSSNVSVNNNQNSTNTSANQNFNNQLNNSNCTKTIGDFEGFMKDLKSHTFEDDKIETIKKDLASSCVYHQQAYKIIETLTFEENRFEIAKFLYARTLDKQLSERGILPLFTFDSTKMDWREFVRNYR